ncbi:hypothetical protein ANO11243_079130 [Dothideomycetidae sp. 11243]|nr:hypothetical protein ANO11243_079130 [fungal sp. No.11243]
MGPWRQRGARTRQRKRWTTVGRWPIGDWRSPVEGAPPRAADGSRAEGRGQMAWIRAMCRDVQRGAGKGVPSRVARAAPRNQNMQLKIPAVVCLGLQRRVRWSDSQMAVGREQMAAKESKRWRAPACQDMRSSTRRHSPCRGKKQEPALAILHLFSRPRQLPDHTLAFSSNRHLLQRDGCGASTQPTLTKRQPPPRPQTLSSPAQKRTQTERHTRPNPTRGFL